jgi:hypothetical protein
MYPHARGHPQAQLSRADWRVIAYRDVQKLVSRQKQALDGSNWLILEVKQFTPQKWLAYWNPKTGKKRVTLPVRKQPTPKRKRTARTSDKNLLSISNQKLSKQKKISF